MDEVKGTLRAIRAEIHHEKARIMSVKENPVSMVIHRELALAYTKLQEANAWLQIALDEMNGTQDAQAAPAQPAAPTAPAQPASSATPVTPAQPQEAVPATEQPAQPENPAAADQGVQTNQPADTTGQPTQ